MRYHFYLMTQGRCHLNLKIKLVNLTLPKVLLVSKDLNGLSRLTMILTMLFYGQSDKTLMKTFFSLDPMKISGLKPTIRIAAKDARHSIQS